jgi:hypothetical protein
MQHTTFLWIMKLRLYRQNMKTLLKYQITNNIPHIAGLLLLSHLEQNIQVIK